MQSLCYLRAVQKKLKFISKSPQACNTSTPSTRSSVRRCLTTKRNRPFATTTPATPTSTTTLTTRTSISKPLGTTHPTLTTTRTNLVDFSKRQKGDNDDKNNKNKNNGTSSSSSSSPGSFDPPRTIVVRQKSIKHQQKHQQQQPPHPHSYGKIKRRFPLENTIRDSSSHVIWVPPPPFNNNNTNNHNTVPQLHASALLDAKTYCHYTSKLKNNTTIAGTEAARRLLRGKKDVLQLIRYVVHSSHHAQQQYNYNSRQQQQQQPPLVALHGHGVPQQLLDHLLHVYGTVLDELEAAEVSFCLSSSSSSTTTSDATTTQWPTMVRMRHRSTGQTSTTTHFQNNNTENAYHLQLLFTVCNRLCTKLGHPVLRVQQQQQQNNKQSTTIQTTPKFWKIELCQGWRLGSTSTTTTGSTTPTSSTQQPKNAPKNRPPMVSWNERSVSIVLQGPSHFVQFTAFFRGGGE